LILILLTDNAGFTKKISMRKKSWGLNMSLQDDYYDVLSTLEGKSEKAAFERIWFKLSESEAKEMVGAGELTEEELKRWVIDRTKALADPAN
jgi:hypothetical protein